MVAAMFAMVVLTMVIGAIAVTSRVKGVKQGQVSVKSFRSMQGEFPDFIVRTTRNFNNQFELPVLFYVACTAHLALHINNTFALAAAWLFVGSRVIHAYIHLSHNNVMHRMYAFWSGVMLVLGLWVNLMIQYYFAAMPLH